ncbi:MAG: hypothetical protein CL928_04455 [Deltaproteobacteria bacterium]|nr:hypothetical protein [Deltaproteobacteria bacterium]
MVVGRALASAGLKRRAGYLLTLIACGAALAGCGTPGEMGYATFYLGGGDDRQGAWSPETPIALESRFAVRASGDQDPVAVDLRSSNSEVVSLAGTSVGPSDERIFLGLGTGTAAVELFDATMGGDGELLDFIRLTISEATDLRLATGGTQERSEEDRLVPPTFAILVDQPVSLEVHLLDSSSSVMNHFDVVEASTDGAPITSDAGGAALYLEANTVGSAQLELSARSQPAVASYEVAVVAESDLAPMILQRIDNCRSSQATVEARFETVDGVSVVGVPVSWSVVGAEDFRSDEDLVEVDLADFPSLPVEVTATAGGQTSTVRVMAAELCAPGCSQVRLEARAGPSIWWAFSVLLLVTRSRFTAVKCK